MENMINARYVGGIAVTPCAASAAAATLEVRGAAVREVPAAVAIRMWDDATTGTKRTGFAPTHIQGSPAWSPPL